MNFFPRISLLYFHLLHLIVLSFFTALAQTASDSSSIATQKDSSQTPGNGVDTMIYYGADTTEGTLNNSTVVLKNNAWVRFKGIEIKAAKITIDQPRKIMIAEAVPDSIDSLGQVARYRGIPEFTESGQMFHGNVMEYNFETKRGKVVMGETKMQDGFYYGSTIRKIGDSTLYIRGGRFTTCDEKEPHFFFRTKEMKLSVRDKVVAKPVILYIHEVPIFAIPFGVFPSKGGRASGITPPVYFETPGGERQIRNFGYYWAPNDYFDALLQADYLDKSGYQLHGGGNYAKRYHYSGRMDFSYSQLHSLSTTSYNDNRTTAGALSLTHAHTLSERSNLNADIRYQSSKNYFQNTSINQQQILNRQQNSNISYNNTFDWGGISASASHSRNLDNGQSSLTFPNATISKSSAAVIPKSEERRNEPDRWYHTIRYSYSANLLGRREIANDTSDVQNGYGLRHNAGFNAPFKVFSYFTFNPNINVVETWYDRRHENFGYRANGQDTSVVKRGFYATHTYSMGASLSTKVYGTSNPNLLGLKTFRHVMTPSVSINYTPDFSESKWGYYESVQDTSGKTVRKDRYGKNLTFGGTPSGRQLSMGFGLAHTFQAKVKTSKKDSTQRDPDVRKIDIMNINNGLSYNFEAEEFKLSNLTTSITVANDLAKNVSLSMNLTHDFYKFDTTLNRRINKFRSFPRLINAGITGGFSVEGGSGTSSTSSSSTLSTTASTTPQGTVTPNYGQSYLPSQRELPSGVPWNARFDFNYDIRRLDPRNVTKTFNGSVSAGTRITQNWQINYSAQINLLKEKIVSQSFSFVRDLHCWTMRFDWTPTGPAAGYFFVIQVKSTQLQDIKLQRTDYGNRIFQ